MKRNLERRVTRLEEREQEDPTTGVVVIVPWQEVEKNGLSFPGSESDLSAFNAWLGRLGYPHAVGRRVTILPGAPPSAEVWTEWAKLEINKKIA